MSAAMAPTGSPQWFVHADEAAWAAAAADDCVESLRRDLATGSARLLLSGGSTPAPVYRALACYGLEWTRVMLALVDERWVPPGDPDSNATLVRDTLLSGRAHAATLEPLLMPDRHLDEAVRRANQQARPASAALLGMGPDGHTASLFPQARGLREALDSNDDYVSVDASGCTGAGSWPLRISLTPHGLAKARRRLLLVRGPAKRDLLEQALAGNDVEALPVRALFGLPGEPLHIHWCP